MPKSEGHSHLQFRGFFWLYFLLLLVVIVSLLSSAYTIGNLQKNSKQAANRQEQVSGSAHISASAEDPPDLLLSVPFYVYEEFAWINATYMGRPISDVSRNMSQDNLKHGDDYWFLEASLKHPMRTHNMSEAKLFFVPFLLNYKLPGRNDVL
jgi:hypothetical protein